MNEAGRGREEKKGRVILSVDADCFYAQAEQIRDPGLRGKPVGVRQKHLVITSSYEARAFGIEKGDSIGEVRRKCPDIVLKNGEDLTWYTELSERWRRLAERFFSTPEACPIERLGLDELFIDVTVPASLRAASTGRDVYAEGALLCEEFRQYVKREMGLETSAGVSWNKLVAKLVAGRKKPFGQTLLKPTADIRQVIRDEAPVTSLPGVGFAAGRLLASVGISTVADCRDFHRTLVTGPVRQALIKAQQLCDGIDPSPVKPTAGVKTISVEDSYWGRPLAHPSADLDAALNDLADKLARKFDVLQPSNPPIALVVGCRRASSFLDTSSSDNNTRSESRSALTSTLSGGANDAHNASMPRRETKRVRFSLTTSSPDFKADVVDAANGLLAQILGRTRPVGLALLSLGLALSELVDPAPHGTQKIDHFLRGDDSSPRTTKRQRLDYAPPAAADVDVSVLADLPPDVRAQVQRELDLASKVVKKNKTPSVLDHFRVASSPQNNNKTLRHPSPPRAPPAAVRPASSQNGPPTSHDAALDSLRTMGFDEAPARDALRRHRGSLAAALDDLLLLDNGGGQQQAAPPPPAAAAAASSSSSLFLSSS